MPQGVFHVPNYMARPTRPMTELRSPDAIRDILALDRAEPVLSEAEGLHPGYGYAASTLTTKY